MPNGPMIEPIDYSGQFSVEEMQKMMKAVQEVIENPPEGWQLYFFTSKGYLCG